MKNFKTTALGLFYATLILAASTSCQKNDEWNSTNPEFSVNSTNLKANKLATLPGSTHGAAHVAVSSSGEYHTAYAGGISFGNYFIYPLSVDPGQQGTPYPYGGSGDFYSPYNMLSVSIDGSNFTMILGTVLGGMTPNVHEAVSNYQAAMSSFLANGSYTIGSTTHYGLPNFIDFANQLNVSVDGLITHHGQFIYDSASPTNVSIVNHNPLPEIGPI